MSNFIPNEIKTFVSRLEKQRIKNYAKYKKCFFKNYKRKGYKKEDKVRLDLFRTECQKTVESAEVTYLPNMGNKLKNPVTSQKSYWKVIHE